MVQLRSSLKMRGHFRGAVGGGEQKADLILILSGFGHQYHQLLLGGEGSLGVVGSKAFPDGGFELLHGLGGQRARRRNKASSCYLYINRTVVRW